VGPELIEIRDDGCGLDAVIAIDSEALGPAIGGVRTRRYPDRAAMLADVTALARAMTIKCALAGLDAGGGKAVILDRPDLDRPRAFSRLGAELARLGGRFRTAGDLGTTAADVAAMAAVCPDYVHTDIAGFAASVARGLAACLRACRGDLAGAAVAIQGCGAVGAAVARRLRALGAELRVADIVGERAAALAAEVSAAVVEPGEILAVDCDVVSPNAVGEVIDREVAAAIRGSVVCGAANNVFASLEAERDLVDRGVLVIPDAVASAGAVIDGIGRSVMGLDDPAPLIDALGDTAKEIADEARRSGAVPSMVAAARARRRIG
jgi:leucine dehydrogenase